MYVHAARWMLVLCLAACDSAPSAPRARGSAEIVAPPSRAALLLDVDRRVTSPMLRTALRDSDRELRLLAIWGLVRIHSHENLPLLRDALRDTDPAMRQAASAGLGALEADAPQAAVRMLALGLAAEPDAETRGAMIRDLARLHRPDAMAAITAALRSDDAAERAGACLGAAEQGPQRPPPAVRSRVAALLGPEEPPRVRLACAYALGRFPPPAEPDARGELVALTLAAADPDPEVRTYAYRALGRQPGVALQALLHGTRDSDWRAASNAFRAFAARSSSQPGGVALYASAVQAAYQRDVLGGDVTPGPPLHVLLAALEAAGPLAAANPPIRSLAERLHRELARPTRAAPSRDRGLAHCAAAELVDRSRGAPARIRQCGLGQVTEAERQAREAAILGDLVTPPGPRAAQLVRLYRNAPSVVKEAVLRATPLVWDPASTNLVLTALREGDPGVLAASCEALAAIARRTPTAESVPPPLAAERATRALRRAGGTIPDGELETLTMWLEAVDAVDGRALVPRVRTLALHPSYAVRHRARQLLTKWEQRLPQGTPPAQPHPIRESDLPPSSPRPRVRIQTNRGELVMELRPDVAPTTVSRFLSLVRRRFYDGLTFHRVVPGFVVQGGDPRGDGYGGPGYWQRCEDNRLPYVRGTVGMALAGRDTGGSQFFITHASQPHLEGRYTVFGQVIEGLEALDAIQPGDRMRSVRLVSP